MVACPRSSMSFTLQNKSSLLTQHRSTFNDKITNSPLWGPLYDGRAIVGPIHEKFVAGASLEECQRSLKEDYSEEEARYIINTWA